MRGALLLLVGVFGLAGCTETATVAPMNDVATKTGPMDIKFKIYGMGHGEVVVTMASGDVLTGAYSLDRNQNILSVTALGALAIFAAGRGAAGGAVEGAVKDQLDNIPAWSPGTADVTSPSGLTAHCLFVNSNVSGHGAGTCHFSSGADYNLTY